MLQSTSNTTENGKEACKLLSDNPNHNIYLQIIKFFYICTMATITFESCDVLLDASKDKIRTYLYKTLKITNNTRGNKKEKLILHHDHCNIHIFAQF